MSRSASEPHFVVLGTDGDRRITLFQAALARLHLPPARFVAYGDVIAQISAGQPILAELGDDTAILRIESPGKDVATAQALLALGATEPEPEGEARYDRLSAHEVAGLADDHGRIWPSRQWYLGFQAVLRAIAAQSGDRRTCNPPEEIALMFDKRACHARLAAADIAVPPALTTVQGYVDLREQMGTCGWGSVFVKLAHGSSASGAVAYRTTGQRHQAITTVEMVETANQLRLYNSRRIRVLEGERAIARLIDGLARHRLHVERWLPKADYAGKVFDLRILTIGGRPRHMVARLSTTPMTNLHLLNARGDPDAIRTLVTEERWQAMLATCTRAASLFRSLYIGMDVLFTANRRHHAILELNGFGDLLPGILDNGDDSYTAEIREVLPCLTPTP